MESTTRQDPTDLIEPASGIGNELPSEPSHNQTFPSHFAHATQRKTIDFKKSLDFKQSIEVRNKISLDQRRLQPFGLHRNSPAEQE